MNFSITILSALLIAFVMQVPVGSNSGTEKSGSTVININEPPSAPLPFTEAFCYGLSYYQSDLGKAMGYFQAASLNAENGNQKELAEYGIQLIKDSRNGSYHFFSWKPIESELALVDDPDIAILHSTLCLFVTKALPIKDHRFFNYRDLQFQKHVRLVQSGQSDLVVAVACQSAIYNRVCEGKCRIPTILDRLLRNARQQLRQQGNTDGWVLRQFDSMSKLVASLELGDARFDWTLTDEAGILFDQALFDRNYAMLEALLSCKSREFFVGVYKDISAKQIWYHREMCSFLEDWGHQVYLFDGLTSLMGLYKHNRDRENAQPLLLKMWELPAFKSLALRLQQRHVADCHWVRDEADDPELIKRFDELDYDPGKFIEFHIQYGMVRDSTNPIFEGFLARQDLRDVNEKAKTLLEELEETNALKYAEKSELVAMGKQLAIVRKETSRWEKVASRALTTAVMAGLATLLLIGVIVINRRRHQIARKLHMERDHSAALKLKLARHQRMDSLGLMAGSVAHDFNNILTGVSGNAELIEMADQRGKFDRQFVLKRVNMIREAADRATKLANQMLNYSGKQFAVRRTLDLNQVVLSYRSVIESASRNHYFNLELANSPVLAEVDDTQIEQVILNLVTNAVQASPDGGEISIRTGSVSVEEIDKTDHTYFGTRQTGGNFAFIEVQDQGMGLTREQLDKIFEPYYSHSGPGRGLGLAVVYGVMESHEGLIHCDPDQQPGAKFRLLFPLASVDQDDSVNEFLSDGFNVEDSLEGKSVLIVDDDPGVLEASSNLLEMIGLKTTAVAGGAECLEALADEQLQFDCILMDVMMPEMPANEVLDQFKSRGITNPVVLMSGFSAQRLDFFLQRPTVKAILPKPFSVDELRRALKKSILDGHVTVVPDSSPGDPVLKGPNFVDRDRLAGRSSNSTADPESSDGQIG